MDRQLKPSTTYPSTPTSLYGERVTPTKVANGQARSNLSALNGKPARYNYPVALLTSDQQQSNLTSNLNLNQNIMPRSLNIPTHQWNMHDATQNEHENS